MSGRHRKPTTSSVSVAKIAVTGAILSGTSIGLAGAAQAASDNEWDTVAACESSGNWAINTGNGYQGGLQFSPSTWLGYGGGQFASAANYATRDQQIAIAEKVLAGQGKGAWPVCGRGLSGPTPRDLSTTSVTHHTQAPAQAPAPAAPAQAVDPAAPAPAVDPAAPAPADSPAAPPAPAATETTPAEQLLPVPAPQDGVPAPEGAPAPAPEGAPVPAPEGAPIPDGAAPQAPEVLPAPAPQDGVPAPEGAPAPAAPATQGGTPVAPAAPAPAAPAAPAPAAPAPGAPQPEIISISNTVVDPGQTVTIDAVAASPAASAIQLQDGVQHLPSPQAPPPGTSTDPAQAGNPNVSYLKELWHAVQNQEIDKNDLILALAQRSFTGPIPGDATPEPAPAG